MVAGVTDYSAHHLIPSSAVTRLPHSLVRRPMRQRESCSLISRVPPQRRPRLVSTYSFPGTPTVASSGPGISSCAFSSLSRPACIG